MYDLSSPDFWVVLGAGVVIGLFFGWMVTSLVQRRANRGANVAQLRKEMDDYRDEVNSHFARTAELFKDTTEKYRDLYEHLAGGAQELCNDLPDPARVEFRPGHLLAAQPRSGATDDEVATGATRGNGGAEPAATASASQEAPSGPARAAV